MLKKSKKLNIVTTCIGELGHFIPMLRLVDALAARGHKVTMMTNKFNETKCGNVLKKSGAKANLVCPDNITRDELIQGKSMTREFLG